MPKLAELSKKCEDLKRKNEELIQAIEFLRLPSADDLHHLFSLPTDVVLRSSSDLTGPGVPAHKTILAIRSPVFKAMLLQSEMEESRTGTINIDDVSRHVLSCFVHYLYTAEFSLVLKLVACELLMLADKYQVNQLRSDCEDFLVSQLTTENALTSFAYASQYNAMRLRHASVTLIVENLGKVKEQDEYQKLVHSNPELVVQMYEAYFDHNQKIKASSEMQAYIPRKSHSIWD